METHLAVNHSQLHVNLGQQEPQQSVHQVAGAECPAAAVLQNPQGDPQPECARLQCAPEGADPADPPGHDHPLHSAVAGVTLVSLLR